MILSEVGELTVRVVSVPKVVGVVKFIAGNLLLVARATPIGILQRVGVVMRVQPTREISETEAKVGAITKHWRGRRVQQSHAH